MNEKQKLIMKLQDEIIMNYEVYLSLNDKEKTMKEITLETIEELKKQLKNIKVDALAKALMNC